MAREKKEELKSQSRRESPPQLTPEARLQYLTGLAFDVVEQRLRDGTATSQETTTLIKAAMQKEKEEVEKTKLEKELIKAKIKNLESEEASAKLYEDALKAFRIYSGEAIIDNENVEDI